jgi:hypothetical protein
MSSTLRKVPLEMTMASSVVRGGRGDEEDAHDEIGPLTWTSWTQGRTAQVVVLKQALTLCSRTDHISRVIGGIQWSNFR